MPGRRLSVDEHRPFLGRSTLMDSTPLTPCWTHRGCRVRLVGHPLCDDAYEIHHSSGELIGCAPSLSAARELIDARIVLVRQRLVATA